MVGLKMIPKQARTIGLVMRRSEGDNSVRGFPSNAFMSRAEPVVVVARISIRHLVANRSGPIQC